MLGPITYKNARVAKEVCKYVPLDKIVIETDCPYLPPEPNRGKRNDSIHLKYIAEEIAKIKNTTIEEIAKITFENTRRIFEI